MRGGSHHTQEVMRLFALLLGRQCDPCSRGLSPTGMQRSVLLQRLFDRDPLPHPHVVCFHHPRIHTHKFKLPFSITYSHTYILSIFPASSNRSGRSARPLGRSSTRRRGETTGALRMGLRVCVFREVCMYVCRMYATRARAECSRV